MKKNKFDRDLEIGWKFRLWVADFINGRLPTSVRLTPVHPYLNSLSVWQKSNSNTVFNRLVDSRNGHNMGLDFDLTCYETHKKTRIIIRWFNDPDIYLKDSFFHDLSAHYDQALILLVDKPINFKIQRYQIIPIHSIKKIGYQWKKTGRKGNKNRLGLYSLSGNLLTPSDFTGNPVNGGYSLFGSTPNIWDALKQFCL
ncbi:MAG: hypothetical protein ACOC2F_00400 [Bacteroidota bacterium]